MAHTLPFARLSLDLTEGQMSLLFAIVRAVSLLGVAFSIVADRRGRRTPLLAAFALISAASLLTAFVPTTAVYAASQSLVRIGVVAIAALGLVLLSEELSPPVRGYGIGLYGLAGSLGRVLHATHRSGAHPASSSFVRWTATAAPTRPVTSWSSKTKRRSAR